MAGYSEGVSVSPTIGARLNLQDEEIRRKEPFNFSLLLGGFDADRISSGGRFPFWCPLAEFSGFLWLMASKNPSASRKFSGFLGFTNVP